MDEAGDLLGPPKQVLAWLAAACCMRFDAAGRGGDACWERSFHTRARLRATRPNMQRERVHPCVICD